MSTGQALTRRENMALVKWEEPTLRAFGRRIKQPIDQGFVREFTFLHTWHRKDDIFNREVAKQVEYLRRYGATEQHIRDLFVQVDDPFEPTTPEQQEALRKWYDKYWVHRARR